MDVTETAGRSIDKLTKSYPRRLQLDASFKVIHLHLRQSVDMTVDTPKRKKYTFSETPCCVAAPGSRWAAGGR